MTATEPLGPFLSSLRDYDDARRLRSLGLVPVAPPRPVPPIDAADFPVELPRPPVLVELLGALLTLARKALP